jgi:hypothetical protein
MDQGIGVKELIKFDVYVIRLNKRLIYMEGDHDELGSYSDHPSSVDPSALMRSDHVILPHSHGVLTPHVSRPCGGLGPRFMLWPAANDRVTIRFDRQ